jgi:hypothetical protein
LKKKPDDSAVAVPTVAPSTVDDKTSVEGTSNLAIVTSTSNENINVASETIGISRATGSLVVDNDKKDPPSCIKKTRSNLHLFLRNLL